MIKDNNFYPNKEKFLRLIKKSAVGVGALSRAHIELYDGIENIEEQKGALESGERKIWFYYSDSISIFGVMMVKTGYTPVKEMILQQLHGLAEEDYPDVRMYFIQSEDIFSSIHH
jgi:hypothetical protein